MIFIKGIDGNYREASTHDLSVRGYEPMADYVPEDDIDCDLEIIVENYEYQLKIKLIKCIRTTLHNEYGKSSWREVTFDTEPPKQRDVHLKRDDIFGLKHIKHFVEGDKEHSIIVSGSAYQQILADLKDRNLLDNITFSLSRDKSQFKSHFQMLVEQREKLMEKIHLIDDLIAQHLYSK
tara:strand:- start:159 stop:695 length:537 start_codon:yes stop_codon:yes gene_type:complete